MKHIYISSILLSCLFFQFSCSENKKPEIINVKNDKEISSVIINVKNDEEISSEINFGVRGNCGMCKSTIESAALSINEVNSAKWSTESKILYINFKDDKFNNKDIINKIHKSIAESGYDTENLNANEDNYEKLPMCCKYDRNMIISQNN